MWNLPPLLLLLLAPPCSSAHHHTRARSLARSLACSLAALPRHPRATAHSLCSLCIRHHTPSLLPLLLLDDIDGESIDGAPLPPGRPPAAGKKLAAPPIQRRQGSSAPSSGAPPSTLGGMKKETKPSQMASFMEELRREQEGRERGEVPSHDRDDYASRQSASSRAIDNYDNGDPETTNLYVGNLNPGITEEVLFNRFSRFGAIQSVKIMWPRTEEEHARGRLCGFVAYVERGDANRARWAHR